MQSSSRLLAAARLIKPSGGGGGLELASDSAAGSKRNLSFQLQAVESTAKRLKRYVLWRLSLGTRLSVQ